MRETSPLTHGWNYQPVIVTTGNYRVLHASMTADKNI